MILLKEITIKNFLSHKNTIITFQENDKYLIDGKSGSGKSSITEAILWSLYGKGRSDNRSLVRKGSKMASVSTKFIDGEQETLITRSVSSAGKNSLSITQNTGSNKQFLAIKRTGLKDLQDWIEKEFLKASYELFTNSVAYPQENEKSFVKASASERKDLLLEIIRAGNFDDLYTKARNAITAKQLESTKLVTTAERLEEDIKVLKADSDMLDFAKKTLDDSTSKIKVKQEKEKELESKLGNISNTIEKLSDKKAVNDNLIKTIEDIQRQEKEDKETLEEYEKLDTEKAKKILKDVEKKQERVTEIEKTLNENRIKQDKINAHLANKPAVVDYEKDIKTLNDRLMPLIKDSGSCPSGDKCPFVKPIKGQITFLTGQIEEKQQLDKVQKEAIDFWEKEYASLVPFEDSPELEKEIDTLRKEIKDNSFEADTILSKVDAYSKMVENISKRKEEQKTEKEHINTRLVAITKEITILEKEVSEFDSNNINLELSTIKNEIAEFEKIKAEASNNIALATRAQDGLKKASQELSEAHRCVSQTKEEVKSIELLKEALSPRGVKAVVIDYLVPQLEEKINEILGQMSDFIIKLDTQQEKVSGDGVKEGLFIKVVNETGDEMDFANYSGGEKVKITVAISEALASLMKDIGFRIMDENIVSLDKESTEGFVDVLKRLQKKFPQLLVISHLLDVKDMFESKINIIKTDGVSKCDKL